MTKYKVISVLFVVQDDSIIKPRVTKLNVGEQASIYCNSRTPKWYFKSPNTKVISFTENLVLQSAALKHNGEYYCFGQYRDYSKHFLAKAELHVFGELFIMC